jgi:hypothetical protein
MLLLLAQVIVMSRKPEFFSYNMPLYEVVTPDGLMRPVLAARLGGLYCGGSARQVGRHSGLGCREDAAQDSCWAYRHVPCGTLVGQQDKKEQGLVVRCLPYLH